MDRLSNLCVNGHELKRRTGTGQLLGIYFVSCYFRLLLLFVVGGVGGKNRRNTRVRSTANCFFHYGRQRTGIHSINMLGFSNSF